MKGYILRDKEVEDEAKKARKAKKQGQWIVGRWNVGWMADSSGSGQRLFQGQPLTTGTRRRPSVQMNFGRSAPNVYDFAAAA